MQQATSGSSCSSSNNNNNIGQHDNHHHHDDDSMDVELPVPMVRLRTNDGKRFTLQESAIACSIALNRMLEGSRQTLANGQIDFIQLPTVRSQILSEILQWTKHHCQSQTARIAAGAQTLPNNAMNNRRPRATARKTVDGCNLDDMRRVASNENENQRRNSNHHQPGDCKASQELRFACSKARTNELTDLDRSYLEGLKETFLLELMHGANYLDVRCLFNACCQVIAKDWEGMKVEEIRKKYNIKSDFSHEEENAMIQENKKLGIAE